MLQGGGLKPALRAELPLTSASGAGLPEGQACILTTCLWNAGQSMVTPLLLVNQMTIESPFRCQNGNQQTHSNQKWERTHPFNTDASAPKEHANEPNKNEGQSAKV